VVVITFKKDTRKLNATVKQKNKKILWFFGVYTTLIVMAAIFVVLFINNSSEAVPIEDVPEPIYEKSYIYKAVKEIQGVPLIRQFPELPSGCEATVATMLLQWAGVDISKEDVATALPKGPVPVRRNGLLYGSNPNNVFVGNPFSKAGYGVYHKPIAMIIDKYLPGQSVDLTGKSFEDILKVIDSGRPVMVWATINLLEPKVDRTWYDEKGKRIEWKVPEHAFLLIGYSDTEVILHDPYTGKRKIPPLELFKARWDSMGKQAVTVSSQIPGKLVVTHVNDLSKGIIWVEVPQEMQYEYKNEDGSAYVNMEMVMDKLSVIVEDLLNRARTILELD